MIFYQGVLIKLYCLNVYNLTWLCRQDENILHCQEYIAFYPFNISLEYTNSQESFKVDFPMFN